MVTLVNRAKVSTATTGTGTITLGAAESGYQTFADAGVVDTNVVRYVIEDGDAWEIGTGTYTATGTTLTRTVTESSNADAAISLTGSAVVYVSAAGTDIVQPSDLATVATTGAYTDLSGLPTLYTDAAVDTHLNTGTATTGEVLSWTGADYDWVAAPASLAGQTDSAFPNETSLGVGAGAVNTGDWNTFIGYEAGENVTTGGQNTAVGFRSLQGSSVTGVRNTTMGEQSAKSISTGRDNTFLGSASGFSATSAEGNVGVGRRTLISLTTGANNVAIGNGALDAATTGGRNIAIGQDAMGAGVATTASGDNIAIGYQAGYDLTTGDKNFLAGNIAGANLTSGSDNVMIGDGAGSNTVTGNSNILVGRLAGRFITSSDNILLGDLTGDAATTGSANVAIGRRVLRSLTTGISNVAIGNGANGITTGSNSVLIGNGSTPSSATASNEITLGNSSITRFRVPAAGIDNTSAALSGTTPSVDVGARDTYTLSTTGNTTFTFTGAPSSGQVGTFSLIITAGGAHTLTWPASVDWAGGTAPDAPASGEKDIYTFMTVDGGTTWYGFLAGDAMA